MGATVEWVRDSLRSAAWAPVTVFVVHLVLSRGFGLYLSVPELDIPMHFVGGVAIAYYFARSISVKSASAIIGTLTRFGRFVLSLALVGLATVVWEFAEWTTDFLGWTQAQVDLNDTVLDMLLGWLGGLLFLLVSLRSPLSVGASSARFSD